MSGFTPTPPPDADGNTSRRGLLSSIAQAIQGVKTFLAAVVMSAGLTLNGTVNQMMKVVPPSTVSGQNFDNPVVWYQLTALNQTNFLQWGSGLTSTTWELVIGWYGAAGAPYIGSRAGPILIGLASGSSMSPINPGTADLGSSGNYWRDIRADKFRGRSGGSGYLACDDATGSQVVYNLTSFIVANGFSKLNARLDQNGADSSATPGSRTGANAMNVPIGKSAIASGQSTCQIENSNVAAGDNVHITWHGDHGQTRDWVTTAAGSFTVNLNAAASSNASFCWEVKKRF